MKVGVLGSGGMGESVIQHLKLCKDVSDIVALDVRAERIRQLKDKYQIKGTTNLRDILSDSAVKLVFVTASNDAHKALTLQALEADKAVMCEKPMANTLADAKAMVDEAERRKVFFQIGFECRYSKLYTKIKEWIDAGLLGQVVNTHCLYITSAREKASWRNKKALGGSMFGEKLSHYVDLPRWWIGSEVKDVFSVSSPNIMTYSEGHDNYHTTYRFKNGAVGHLTFMMGYAATFRGDPLQPNITDLQLGDGHKLRYIVVGTKGAAEADVFYRRIKRWQFGDAPDVMTSDWVENLTWDKKEDHFYYHNTTDQTHDIVKRVLTGQPPKTSARDAYETMRLSFAAEESADTGSIVSLDKMR
ncbi:MAG: Gfo/Idh/MocA family oxidoreductase [Verrucomicrobia bacterium]|nr:Gfo/Idh/MocA family oxidoreductase [Verrucomicrobiota bacterium]